MQRTTCDDFNIDAEIRFGHITDAYESEQGYDYGE